MSLNDLHEKLTFDAFFGKWTVWRWFNSLPTASKYRMDKFRQEWDEFNLGLIQSARKVKPTFTTAKDILITQQNGVPCPAERIYQGVERNEMSKTEVKPSPKSPDS